MSVIFYFFFSSRRRHTRFKCDWSSDVCSSDLPTILGVAVGGGADIVMRLAKAALLRPLDQPNPNPEQAQLEKELYEAANSTGIGPMGLGGKFTVLGVKVDYAHRH